MIVCTIVVGVDDASFIIWVKLVSPIGSAAGGSGNLSTSLSKVARLRHIQNLCEFSNVNCDGTIIYNDPVGIRI
jgi:hypothetical protein